MILTDDEYKILFSIKKENKYKWIVRDCNDKLRIFQHKPFKDEDFGFWDSLVETYDEDYELNYFDFLFQFIKWQDNEPYNIEELLK